MKIRSIQELRSQLCEVFCDLREDKMQPAVAVEINNAAGKIINSAKVELEYAGLRKESPNIPFLNAV